ncbi:MAG: hypothetical protein WDO24_16320 [Pseudomonadota bacterium]
MADDPRPPADTGDHQEGIPLGFRLQDLREFGAQPERGQARGFVEDRLQPLLLDRVQAELRQKRLLDEPMLDLALEKFLPLAMHPPIPRRCPPWR